MGNERTVIHHWIYSEDLCRNSNINWPRSIFVMGSHCLPLTEVTDTQNGDDHLPKQRFSTNPTLQYELSHGSVTYWQCSTQSISKSEYMSAVSVRQKILWVCNILQEFGSLVMKPSALHIDNQSCVSVSNNPYHCGGVQHLNVRFYVSMAPHLTTVSYI
jgi:hypothetical protein